MNIAFARFLRASRLVCPRCGVGRLFRGVFTMEDACSHCGLDFKREPGFYLGSIYINYGITALGTGGLYLLLAHGLGLSRDKALAVCLAVAVLFPVWFFRYARSFLLAIDSSVNRELPEFTAAHDGTGLSAEELAAHRSADGSAGCFMGVALVLVLLFGLAMAIATIVFTMNGEPPQ